MRAVILLLVMFGLGYALGRRFGIKEGRQLGLVEAVINLRIEGLENGSCPICLHGADSLKDTTTTV